MAQKKQQAAPKAAKAEGARHAYPVSRAAALKALDKHGVDGNKRDQLLAAAAGAEEHQGHPVARLARHVLKWLPDGAKETTIPLTDSEAATLGFERRP